MGQQVPRGNNAAVVGAVIAAGVVLSFGSALVPFFSTGYKLDYGVMLVGLLPYLVYGSSAPLLARSIAVASGVLLLLVHSALVIGTRIVDTSDFTCCMLYYVPVLMAVLMSPLLVLAQRQPY